MNRIVLCIVSLLAAALAVAPAAAEPLPAASRIETITVYRGQALVTRTVDLPAGQYRFSVTADDGVRLWVNNHLLIDAWREQAATTYTAEMHLPGGSVPIKMEYFEKGGKAVAKLTWEALYPSIGNWRGEYFLKLSPDYLV